MVSACAFLKKRKNQIGDGCGVDDEDGDRKVNSEKVEGNTEREGNGERSIGRRLGFEGIWRKGRQEWQHTMIQGQGRKTRKDGTRLHLRVACWMNTYAERKGKQRLVVFQRQRAIGLADASPLCGNIDHPTRLQIRALHFRPRVLLMTHLSNASSQYARHATSTLD